MKYFSSAEQVHSSLPMPSHFSVQNLKYQNICTCCFVQGTCLSPVKLDVYRVEAGKLGLPSLSSRFLKTRFSVTEEPMKHEQEGGITNKEFLASSQSPSTDALLTLMQLHWAGYMWRMDDGKMLKQLLGDKLKWDKRMWAGKEECGYQDVC